MNNIGKRTKKARTVVTPIVTGVEVGAEDVLVRGPTKFDNYFLLNSNKSGRKTGIDECNISWMRARPLDIRDNWNGNGFYE